MPRKSSTITVTDQFCGAGGSSQGVRLVARKKNLNTGLEVKLAMNHWKLAIETHNTNFPDTDHACTDISACDPRRYPSTDILITSPECTVHSPAGGGQAKKRMYGNQMTIDGKLASEEAEERSRATMWDVCRFAEYHNYRLIIVENVIEARKWVLFDTWLAAMKNLGYEHEVKYINSMHAHPTPQSRDRMYCVFWRKGNKRPNLEFNPVASCKKCLKNVEAYQWWKPKPKKSPMPREHGKYKWQYLFKCPECHSEVEPYFYAAFNCIDWTKPGIRIGDRKKKLSDKTEQRCEYGIDKYWSEPNFVELPAILSSRYIQGIGNRVRSSGDALPVQVTDGRESILFPQGAIINLKYDGLDRRVKSTADPLQAQTTQEERALIAPPLIMDAGWSERPRIDQATIEPLATQDTGQTKGIVMPLVVKNYSGPPQAPIKPGEPLGAVTTSDHHGLLNVPLVVKNYGTSKAGSSVEAMPAVTTNLKHGIITQQSFKSFIAHYYSTGHSVNHITEAMKTLTTVEGAGLLTPRDYKKPKLEDCFYRMLLPNEIQLGMAFDEDYIVLGDSRQKVKQLGNAVTPPVMEFLVERCVETLF